MEILYTKTFKAGFKKLPSHIQEATGKKLALLLKNFRHSSLRTKKIKSHLTIWEASITMEYRLTFQIKENTIILRKIGTHKILKKP